MTEQPFAGPRTSAVVRKHQFSTFRYDLIHVAESQEIIVVAVAHHRRRAGYWLNRLALLN